MLYTVSAVQILVMVDAVGELETRGKGGKERLGKCQISWIACCRIADPDDGYSYR